MGISDSFKDMAGKAVDKMGGSDKVKDAVEKTGDKVDERTGGKHADKIDKGQNMAREQLDRMKGDNRSGS